MIFILIVQIKLKLEYYRVDVIPPNDNNTEKYFKSLNELNKSLA